MAKKKMRVRKLELEKMKSGEKGHAYKVTVHHHDQKESGKGLHASIGRYVPPEEHSHPTRAKAMKHINELTDSMSVSPDGDGDESMPDSPAQTSALNE